MDLISTTIGSTLVFLQTHALLAYLILFFGSFLETVIGVGFFIYGELFFLPGAILAGSHVLNIWLVILSLVAGGVLGDSLSFFIGAKYGIKVFTENGRFLNHKNREKGEEFFRKYGDKGIFLARLMGPLSWITPFLAGVYALPYRRFLKYNIPGVIVGIGQFLVVGYFFGSQYKQVLSFVQTYVAIILFVVLALFAIYFIIKRNQPQLIRRVKELWRFEKGELLKGFLKHTTAALIIILAIYVIFLYVLLFVENNRDIRPVRSDLPIVQMLQDVKNQNSLLVYKDGSKLPLQPVNVIIVADGDVDNYFKEKNWFKDVLFSEGNLTARSFIRLWNNHEPPVSDLYLDGYPQDLAFQETTGSSLHRLHIRLWKVGYLNDVSQAVYFGSVSDDDGLSIALYNHFPVPFHEINPDVDLAREQFSKLFLGQPFLKSVTYEEWGDLVAKTSHPDEQNYFTDGRILVLELK